MMCDEDDWVPDFTPEQIAEIKRRSTDDEPFATDEEVKAAFDRMGISRPRS